MRLPLLTTCHAYPNSSSDMSGALWPDISMSSSSYLSEFGVRYKKLKAGRNRENKMNSLIGATLRSSHHVSLVGSANSFGDDQLNVDVASENLMRAALAKCPLVVRASSEEDPEEKEVHQGEASSAVSSDERFSVAFDPLDGSSIIAANWSVGTIVGVWKGETTLGKNPRDQICSLLGVHGPRTTVIVAIREVDATEGFASAAGVCFELGLDDNNKIELLNPNIKLSAPPYKTRYFAPANLRFAADSPSYSALISSFITKKGHGVYVNPVAAASKAKLRRLYEILPVGLVVECAGGKAVDENGKDVLAKEVQGCDERGGIVFGNTDEVEEVVRALMG
ncbi:hypothetical protein TrVGV298_011937 [Trichoderma virens]|nr:hypothetical protein TrVGV298_011937 [Trichoderma virens]